MPAYLECCDWVIRYGPETRKHGDPYIGTLVMSWKGTVESLLERAASVTGHPGFAEKCDYVVYYGPDARRPGDPHIGCVAVKREGSECELVGFAPPGNKMPSGSPSLHRDVLGCLAEHGLTAATVRRLRPDGTEIVKRFDLTRGGRVQREAQ